jgi:parvulin-like peptidyl-prolyl isomerase
MRNIRRFIGITAVLVFVFMALGATVALAAPLAQSEDPESEVPEEGTEEQVGPCGVGQEVIEQVIDHEALDEIMADALGMTVEELQEAKESGQHLRDLAEAQDVDLDEVKAAVDEARAEMVQQAVDDELITEEQAECILSHAGRCNKGGRGRGFGGFGSGQAAPENTGLSA